MRLLGKAVFLFALFVLVLAAGSLAVFRFDPFREVDQLRQKWTHWQQHKDEYNSLFIGSSRVQHGLMPTLFDKAAAAAGVPTHSFNFGVDAMLAPEDAYVAEFVLRDHPKNLKWVFVELAMFADDLEGRDPSTARTRHWHDWPRTWLCIRSALWPKQKPVKWKRWFEADPGKKWPIDLAWNHFRLFAMRALNIGRGAASVQEWLVPERDSGRIGPDRDGFVPYSDDDILKGAAREQYIQQLKHWQQNPARFSVVRGYHKESVDCVLRAIRATGAKPVLFVAPNLGPLRFQMPHGDDLLLLDFSGVADYPDLFEPDVRVDIAHLSPLGAERFTNHFIEKFTKAVAPREGEAPAIHR